MKNLFYVILAICCFSSFSLARDVFVGGYTKSNGTYVDSYHRSSPNGTTLDNYSVSGNPYKSDNSYDSNRLFR